MSGYVQLLRHPGAGVPWMAAMLSRVVLGMAVVSVILLVRRSGMGYGAAGLAAAVMSLGTAVATPVWGRRIDRVGPVPLLVRLGAGYLVAAVVLATVVTRDAPLWTVLAAAGAMGMSYPPVSPVARVAWRRIYGLERRDRAFSLDGATVEIGFVAGPILAAALVDLVAPWVAVVVAGAAMAVATVAFSRAPAIRGMDGSVATLRGGALRVGAVRVLMAIFLCVGVAFGTIDVLAPAVAEANGRPTLAGVLLGTFAFGSAIGGLVYGSRPWPGTRHTRLLVLSATLVVSMLAVSAATDSVVTFGVVAMVGGVVIAPTIVLIFALADDLTPASVVTEALSWINTAVLAGAAGGAAMAGQVVERVGIRPTVFVASGVLALAVVIVASFRRTLSAEPLRT